MTDRRTISQLEAEGYPWIGCECCKGTVWVPFKMIRQKIPHLSAMTLDELGARMRCDKCGKRPDRYYPARQEDAPGFLEGIRDRGIVGTDYVGGRYVVEDDTYRPWYDYPHHVR